MKDELKERLKDVLKIQTESYKQWRMFAYLIRKIKATPNTKFFVQNGNIYVTKESDTLQEIPPVVPCIVAHMDTVHEICEDLSLLEVGDYITGFNCVKMKQTGVGGDDKVGVFIALEALNFFENIKAVFFRDEEVGCMGSDFAKMSFFDNCSMVLQCDRRGNDEFITDASGTQLGSKKFRKEISKVLKNHGYKFAYGMMTDVMTLKEAGLPVSAANIACGYYNPHTDHEYVSVKDVAACRALVFDIFSTLGTQRFPHTYVSKWESTYYGGAAATGAGFSYKGKDDWHDKTHSKNWWDEPDDHDQYEWAKGGDGVWRIKKGGWKKKNDESERIECGSCMHEYLPSEVEFVPALNVYLCKKDCLAYFQDVPVSSVTKKKVMVD